MRTRARSILNSVLPLAALCACANARAPRLDGGAAPAPLTSCELEAVTAADLGTQSWVECGSLHADDTARAVADARACAEAARAQQTPFRLLWDSAGSQDVVRRAVVGVRETVGYQLHLFEQHAQFGTNSLGPEASWAACNRSFDFVSSCGDVLCVECSAPGNSACQCTPAPDAGGAPFAYCG